jgi:hypothetical protein
MMDVPTLITTVVTSAGVSGLVTFLLKTYFKTRIEHCYQVELEKCKSDLAAKLGEERDIASRRMQGYPLLVELVYRIRNMARDLSTMFSRSQISLADELVTRTQELEDNLFRYRSDLERDGFFTSVHAYKNAAKNFNMKLSDIRYFLDHEEEERAGHAKQELATLYSTIEDMHSSIIHDLSVLERDNKQS